MEKLEWLEALYGPSTNRDDLRYLGIGLQPKIHYYFPASECILLTTDSLDGRLANYGSLLFTWIFYTQLQCDIAIPSFRYKRCKSVPLLPDRARGNEIITLFYLVQSFINQAKDHRIHGF